MKTIIAFIIQEGLETTPSPFYNHQFTGLNQNMLWRGTSKNNRIRRSRRNRRQRQRRHT